MKDDLSFSQGNHERLPGRPSAAFTDRERETGRYGASGCFKVVALMLLLFKNPANTCS